MRTTRTCQQVAPSFQYSGRFPRTCRPCLFPRGTALSALMIHSAGQSVWASLLPAPNPSQPMPPYAPSGHPTLCQFNTYPAPVQNNQHQHIHQPHAPTYPQPPSHHQHQYQPQQNGQQIQHAPTYQQQQYQPPQQQQNWPPHKESTRAAPDEHAVARDDAGDDYDPFADSTPPPSSACPQATQTLNGAANREKSEDEGAGGYQPETKRQKVQHDAGAPPEWSPRTVFVWDLDETLIVFNSLLVGKVPGGDISAALSQSLLEKAEILEVFFFVVPFVAL